MSRILYADGTGWVTKKPGGPPPTVNTARITAINAEGDGTVGPPPPSTNIAFGWNSVGARDDQLFAAGWNCWSGRLYVDNANLPSDGSFFTPGGQGYVCAGLNRAGAGVQSGKRFNISVHYTPTAITSTGSPYCVMIRNFVNSIPAGWEVQINMWHEFNLHYNTTDHTAAQHKAAHIILSDVIATASANNVNSGGGIAIPVINPSLPSNSVDSNFALASQTADTTEFHWDAYDNPRGQLKGGYQYEGQEYWKNASHYTALYAQTVRLGYTGPNHGWGIDEVNAPRRCGLRLAAITTMATPAGNTGWGPSSPHDVDGSGQAQSITDMMNFCLNAGVRPSTVHMFVHVATAPGKFSQDFWTMGRADNDPNAGTGQHQGWPVASDPSRPVAAYKAFTDISQGQGRA